jgi:hypothetical protein
MTLKPMYRNQLLTMKQKEEEKMRTTQITRIARSIYAAVIHSSKKKDDKFYTYPVVYNVLGSHNVKDIKFQEFVSDIIYMLNGFFPDSKITHGPGQKCELINIDWS